MPKVLIYAFIIIAALITVPGALILRARVVTSDRPRIHIFQDMDNQPRFGPQAYTPIFEDERAMRLPVPGTVARDNLRLDDHYFRGVVDGDWATRYPERVNVSESFVLAGQERFNIYCAPCHGYSGYGDGMIARRATQLQSPGWIPPTSLHDQAVRDRPLGHLFNTITHGIRTMPAYGPQISVEERWAIVAYIKALQLSQNASQNVLSPQQLQALQ